MYRDIYVNRTIELDYAQQIVLPYIWHLKNIEYCEVKADQVQVSKDSEQSGTYTVHGHFARLLPWSRTFAYQLHPTGFHSTEAANPVSSFDIQGGFTVEPLSENRCLVNHYEQYKLPLRFWLLKPLIVYYLKRSQVKEMQDLAALIRRNESVKQLQPTR